MISTPIYSFYRIGQSKCYLYRYKGTWIWLPWYIAFIFILKPKVCLYIITFKAVFVYLGKSKLVCRKRADFCNRIFSIFAVAWNHGGSSNNACHRHSQRRYSNDELGMVNIINRNNGNVYFLGKIIRATNAT